MGGSGDGGFFGSVVFGMGAHQIRVELLFVGSFDSVDRVKDGDVQDRQTARGLWWRRLVRTNRVERSIVPVGHHVGLGSQGGAERGQDNGIDQGLNSHIPLCSVVKLWAGPSCCGWISWRCWLARASSIFG